MYMCVAALRLPASVAIPRDTLIPAADAADASSESQALREQMATALLGLQGHTIDTRVDTAQLRLLPAL